ncbi:MAG: archaeosortase/exosortase family protein [Victivallaceae bacterium]|nr:archaeosortase/exosortase family protein [Victivallaceae bacterium]
MNSVHIYPKFNPADFGFLAIPVLTAVYGLAEAWRTHQQPEAVITLWILAAGMSTVTVRHYFKTRPPARSRDIILSWIFLAAAGGTLLLTAFISDTLALRISLLLAAGACLARFVPYQVVFKLFPAGAIFLLWLPNSTYFDTVVSYPLRLIASNLTCFILRLCTVNVSCDATVLTLGPEKIAVTAACSGIAQLEAMFLIGWIITMLVHQRLICRISHWLLLLPIVILVNSLRLAATLLLYSAFGPVAFGNTVHSVLGYAMVIAVAALFWACRSLIPFSETGQTKRTKRRGEANR